MALCLKTLITPFFNSPSMIRSRGFESQKQPQIARIFSVSDPSTNTSLNSNTNSCLKRCLRCNTLYDPLHNSPTACSFHAHITGKGRLFTLAPRTGNFDFTVNDRSEVAFSEVMAPRNCSESSVMKFAKVTSAIRINLELDTEQYVLFIGEKGLYALAPPHQGIDGEWTDHSGVIVYKWNEKNNRPNTGSANWKKRWSCCSEYDENASPCRKGWHVSYDDGFTMY